MRRQEFERFQQRYPQPHAAFFARPIIGRRVFLQAATMLLPFAARASTTSRGAQTKNTAKNLIFILMKGGPSHVDTFDLKTLDGVSPAELGPERIGGLSWPAGLLPNLAGQMESIALVRSMRAWALVHETGQRWVQIGRNPLGAEGQIAPHIGSVIAREKHGERRPTDSFPPFVAIDASDAAGQGYFSARYAPFKYVPSIGGVADTSHPDGQTVFDARLKMRAAIEPPSSISEFYEAAIRMMNNSAVEHAFRYSEEESARYGGSPFGNACLVAKQVLAEDRGTRAIMIRVGGWDSHSNIYSNTTPTNIFNAAKPFDAGLAALIGDLKSNGLLDQTLIVAGGEFGRTPGALTAAGGRDHHLQQSFLLCGGGVRGGRAIGSTDATGAATAEAGWSRDRDIRIEDMEATIYSALGIDWTTVLNDGPSGPFPYIPHSDKDLYGPIHELWD